MEFLRRQWIPWTGFWGDEAPSSGLDTDRANHHVY
jgi:hypothetical protein